MDKSWIVPVEVSEDGEYYIQFTDEMLEGSGFKLGDSLDWIDQGDGSYLLKKKETTHVLVECISTYRMRYVVEVPSDHPEYALDTVVCQEAKEFSQEWLGETIVSHRQLTREQVIELCDKDNDYAKSWDEDHKMKTFVTEEGYKGDY